MQKENSFYKRENKGKQNLQNAGRLHLCRGTIKNHFWFRNLASLVEKCDHSFELG